jgi:hypothetical protein
MFRYVGLQPGSSRPERPLVAFYTSNATHLTSWAAEFGSRRGVGGTIKRFREAFYIGNSLAEKSWSYSHILGGIPTKSCKDKTLHCRYFFFFAEGSSPVPYVRTPYAMARVPSQRQLGEPWKGCVRGGARTRGEGLCPRTTGGVVAHGVRGRLRENHRSDDRCSRLAGTDYTCGLRWHGLHVP